MTVQAAVDTGRIHPRGRDHWELRFAADPVGTGKVLASLYPALGEDRARDAAAASGQVWAGPGSESDTPLTDQLEGALYGPKPDDRRRREDLEAEASLRAQLEEERKVAAAPTTSPTPRSRRFAGPQ